MPIEQQQPGNVEAETQVFAKIPPQQLDPATIPGVAPVTPPPAAVSPPAVTPAAPKTAAPKTATAAAAREPKSLTRRLARRILGPTLMTKK
ncbi:hypothetical protein [Lentzea cavernae]|uniref:Uncharacterized protein n=1 Tax=Lentzea cavernae TaxID=2020703 RepID=A0ABQ3MKT9_9PSEU|nr:hypothetical protein [Lentzea cavernae]GHH41754.1 hypothetical protein GCM10017774_36880 [Lentzea cavernae]